MVNKLFDIYDRQTRQMGRPVLVTPLEMERVNKNMTNFIDLCKIPSRLSKIIEFPMEEQYSTVNVKNTAQVCDENPKKYE